MLIKHTPDAYEKLRILGGMATDDILTQPETRAGHGSPYPASNKNPTHGVYRASMPNGKYINLMRVMFTDFCKMDCHYCPNSHWVPRKRYAFKVDELARTFAELVRRQTVSGLFLSSGIAGDGSKTTEKLVKVVDAVRNKYGFKGYIHMKVMPGAEYEYVEAAYRLGTRLSVNMETPTVEHMQKLSKMKDLKRDILDPMEWVHNLTESHTNGAVGQATQLVVGAADESDRDIFGRMDQLYTEWKFKRIYYAPFQPVRYTPLEEHPPTPMARSHRLYQVDWLKRVYRFSNDELDLAFADNGFLPLDQDPKTSIAVENLDAFPMDINHAGKNQLLRIPGVGPTSADVRRADSPKQEQAQHRHMARPNRDGRGEKARLALPRLPRTPPASRQAAQAGPVRRGRERKAQDADYRKRASASRPLRRADVLLRLPDARYARPPVRRQPERAANGKLVRPHRQKVPSPIRGSQG